jgi:gliding motility-associated-like protein
VDSVKSLVNVFPLPQAAFSTDYTCEDSPAQFTDASSIPQGNISTWFWTLGDNTTTSEINPVHTYSTPGNYNVHLRIASDHGCPDSTDDVIRIVPRPVVDFATENACLGYPVNLTDFSQAVTGSIVQYNWNFGDGSASPDQNPQHTYLSHGWFQVSLTATTDSGCVTTLVRPNALNIYPLPAVNFSSNASESSDVFPQVNFYNQTGSQGVYFWNFGDGETSTEYSPTHLYPTTGVYDVQLMTIDQNGCVDSTLLRIEIKPTSNVYIPNAFTPNGDANNDLFRVYSYNVKDMKVQIYDRWGLKIVEWDSPFGAWDGRVDGSPAQADVYVYRVSTIDVNDKHEVRIGHVSLVR